MDQTWHEIVKSMSSLANDMKRNLKTKLARQMTSAPNSQQQSINIISTNNVTATLGVKKVNQTAINTITTDKVSQRSEELTLGHDRDDQRLLQTNGKDNKSSSNKLKDIKKFDGRSNPEEWLEYEINRLDEMNFSIQEKYKSIPELLSGKALIWYSDEQEKMPNFVLFIKHFLKHYQQNMDQSCNSTPMIQDNVTYQQNDRKDDVINSLRNQMLIMNLEKFPKFSGKSKQNPSKWLADIQEKMEILKLTDDERLALMPSCLEAAAHDWINDNKNSIPAWQIIIYAEIIKNI